MELKSNDRKSPEDIYQILGISSETVSTEQSMDSDRLRHDHTFDNKNSVDFNLLWKHYRLCMILGIAAVAAAVILWIVAIFDISSLFSSSRHSELYYEDSVYENIYEDTAGAAAMVEESQKVDVVSGYDSDNESQYLYGDNFDEATTEPSMMYFKGTINDRYPIHLYLDISDFGGKYYYDKSGPSNFMILNIVNMEPNDDSFVIVMEEYNADSEICGHWSGTLTSDGIFSGYGEFLGKTMPFHLEVCEPND